MPWNSSLKWKLAYKYSMSSTDQNRYSHPSGRHFGEAGTVMLAWDLVKNVPISGSIKPSCCCETKCPFSSPNIDSKYYIWILLYSLISPHPIHCAEEIVPAYCRGLELDDLRVPSNSNCFVILWLLPSFNSFSWFWTWCHVFLSESLHLFSSLLIGCNF